MVIIDTNILIEIARNNRTVIQMCESIGSEQLCISQISYVEFLRGVHNKEAFAKAQTYLNDFEILKINEQIGDIFIRLFDKYTLSHRPSIPDVLIASTSIYYEIPLLTLNQKDFRYIEDLKLFETKSE